MGNKEKSDWAKIIGFLLALLPLIVQWFLGGDDDNK